MASHARGHEFRLHELRTVINIYEEGNTCNKDRHSEAPESFFPTIRLTPDISLLGEKGDTSPSNTPQPSLNITCPLQ